MLGEAWKRYSISEIRVAPREYISITSAYACSANAEDFHMRRLVNEEVCSAQWFKRYKST
jgi:hypothetical protein